MIGIFILGAVVVLALWLLFSMLSKRKAVKAFNVADEADPWFLEQGIKVSSVLFDVYDKPGMAKHFGASVIVGVGKRDNGEDVGFVLEVLPGSGVVEACYLKPYGVATEHRFASLAAGMSGRSLTEVLQEAAREHRARRGIPE